MKRLFFIIVLIFLVHSSYARTQDSVTLKSAVKFLKSFDPKGLDTYTSEAQDFYQYVNKRWIDDHPLSDERASYSQYDILNDSSNNRIQRLIFNLSKANLEEGSNAHKIAILYQLGMDSIRRNELGVLPILDDLAKIENATSEEMTDLFLWLHRNYISPFFYVSIIENVSNSNEYAMYIRASQLCLGDRDYYLKNDRRNTDVRDAYMNLIENQMMNAGFSEQNSKRIVKNVIKVETLLADSIWTREESRNYLKMYNPRSIAQLNEMYPHFPWERFFIETLDIVIPEQVIVTELNSIRQADFLMSTLTDREKKDYYLWQYVNAASPYLSDDFLESSFEFNMVMSGIKKQRPRWKEVLSVTENYLGEAIGQIYVEEYFPISSKEIVGDIVENLRNALAKHIIKLTWMTDDTKLQAIKKLNATTVKIGYPDKWKDYSALILDPELSYWENIHRANLWMKQQELKKWGKEVDNTVWSMTPQTINAYANALHNEIVFPAGILQPPFFDPQASDAENYGGIGVIIAHELTHGFDDQGRHFDADGNMVNWWTPNDSEIYNNLSRQLVKQFSEVEVLPGLMANGEFTLGENIADQGGLQIAVTAFIDSQRKKEKNIEEDDALVEGFSPLQIFFINFANGWAYNIREEEIRSLTAGDVHSLAKNRVNVSLRNIEKFYKAFEIKEGDKMFLPESERAIIW